MALLFASAQLPMMRRCLRLRRLLHFVGPIGLVRYHAASRLLLHPSSPIHRVYLMALFWFLLGPWFKRTTNRLQPCQNQLMPIGRHPRTRTWAALVVSLLHPLLPIRMR